MEKYLIPYLIIISIFTFFIYSIDKRSSKQKNKRRISEKTLLTLMM